MLDGWYCRSIANMQANEASSVNNPVKTEPAHSLDSRKDYSSDSSSEAEPEPNYKAQYLSLKKKLKFLIYENECFQDALRSSQKRLLRVSRDRSFLLDRLLQYEKHDSSTSDSEETESSDDNSYSTEAAKRKKAEANSVHQMSTPSLLNRGQNSTAKRKRNPAPKKQTNIHQASMMNKASPALGFGLSASDGHMTPEEVERHLQSRQSYLELLPERAPPTVPTEMFSNDPSLDSESNDVQENSPNVEEWFD
ncbi:INO80 complex subunit E [Aricia agestis]|uniref:INO80 complex subunit E n=1 Tax=Aricia agestis TaxID=91739 RepID=UPI001C204709|nr:INO80 complex subunit E [Aricia agestis]